MLGPLHLFNLPFFKKNIFFYNFSCLFINIHNFHFRLSKTYSCNPSLKNTLGLYVLKTLDKKQKIYLKNLRLFFFNRLALRFSWQNEPKSRRSNTRPTKIFVKNSFCLTLTLNKASFNFLIFFNNNFLNIPLFLWLIGLICTHPVNPIIISSLDRSKMLKEKIKKAFFLSVFYCLCGSVQCFRARCFWFFYYC